jgi:hypothetical protein
MRTAHCISFFRQAVLLALAVPACGGKTDVGDVSDGRAPDDAHPLGDSSPSDAAACSPTSEYRYTCNWAYSFAGDPVTCVGFTSTGTLAQCLAACGDSPDGRAPDYCDVTSDPGGTWTLKCNTQTDPNCPVGNGGRRADYFAALGFDAPPVGRELGTHFARASCMEASSVEAFRMLRDELVAYGAPKRLVRAARRAIRDEQRHVRQTSALARRFGEEPIAPAVPPPRRLRSLEAMALDNAREGCVRETFSALECAWQAQVAADPVVRATMNRIAQDELRHLALSWDVHAWVMGRLDAAARARVACAQREEIAALRRETKDDPHPSLVSTAGLPRRAQSAMLLAAIATRAAA